MYACFVDFSKAYDSVWRVGLLYKLILNGLSTKLIHLIKSMYEDLQLSVKLSDGVTLFFDSLNRGKARVQLKSIIVQFVCQ